MSYGMMLLKVQDHFMSPYMGNISSIIGMEVAAENLGLVTQADGELEAAPAAQDQLQGAEKRELSRGGGADKVRRGGLCGVGCLG